MSDWAGAYARLSRGLGGFSLEQFGDLTIAQLKALLEAATEEQAGEREFDAALHGRQLERRKHIRIDPALRPEMDNLMAARYEAARKRGEGHA